MLRQNEQERPSEIAGILQRAAEIQEATSALIASDIEIENFVKAAEEAGVHRDAIMQALRERLAYSPEAFSEGELLFAKSHDGYYYVARLVSMTAGQARVRFASGGEGNLSIRDLRPFFLSPGQVAQLDSPSSGMWFGARVTRVNTEGGSVTFNLWGTEETVPLEKVRLPRDKPQTTAPSDRFYMWTIAISAAAGGGILGALLTFILRR